ncbi:uncharacterized protein LOC124360256 [Homalodisca vitripennis]|uniref:uncharacterized protein LOC124360256 n=1 Tax=Homalodisca vitripennis TaxID=197043 RepID=UPI001EEB16EE|nr:uncharacterized protein LOC124360256 [Homalodisca vitripennis]
METIRDLLSERLSEHLPVERNNIPPDVQRFHEAVKAMTEMISSPVFVDVQLLSSWDGYAIEEFAAKCHSTPVACITVKQPPEENPQSRRDGAKTRYIHVIHCDDGSIDECQLVRYTPPLFTAGRDVVVTNPVKADVLNK